MSLAIVYSRAALGMQAPLITVEVHLTKGLPAFNIVGLPETAVKESKDRVRSALVNSHFDFPICRITVNLAPADLPKEGSRFDLAIALGILAASKQLPQDTLQAYEFIGELALTGDLRAIRGVLPVVLHAHLALRQVVVPIHNEMEAALVKEASVFAATHLLEVCAHLKSITPLKRCEVVPTLLAHSEKHDLSDIKGQPHAKRALEIAAAGRHSVLFVGPPGTGKTMLASRLTSILPDMTDKEALEAASVVSISHTGFNADCWKKIPFRAPHHSASSIALVGGGRPPRPGEISLAHHGVLFLDELPEFSRHALECLREPLESGKITISRASFQAIFPAHFQLIAAMNPCPCGYANSATHTCHCTPEQIRRYLSRISGPLLNRIDMHMIVSPVSPHLLQTRGKFSEEPSLAVRLRVMKARGLQMARQMKYNSELTVPELEKYCHLTEDASKLLHEVMLKFNFSARVYHRLIKVARTIADLAAEVKIEERMIGEVLNFRYLDRLGS